MGQSCGKLGSKNAIFTAPASRNAKDGAGASSSQAITLEAWLAQESHVRRISQHLHVRQVIRQLNSVEVQILLSLFRSLCLEERKSTLHFPQQLLPHKQRKHLEKQFRAYRRLSLQGSTLQAAFPALSASTFTKKWGILLKLWGIPPSCPCPSPPPQLLEMFAVSEGWTALDVSPAPSSVLFADFCAVFAILLHGSKEDLVSLLSLLFAPMKSSTSSEQQQQQQRLWTESAAWSLLVFLALAFVHSHMDGEEERWTIKTSSAEEELLLNTLRNIITAHVSQSAKGLGRSPSISSTAAPLGLENDAEAGRGESLIELVTSPLALESLSLSQFLAHCIPVPSDRDAANQPMAPPTPLGTGFKLSLQLCSIFHTTSVDVLKAAFRPMVWDVIINPFTVLQDVLNMFAEHPQVVALRTSIQSCQVQSLDTLPLNAQYPLSTEMSSTSASQPTTAMASSLPPAQPVLLIEARWWQIWCTCMEVEAIYCNGIENLQHLVIDLRPNPRTTGSKYHRFNPFQATQDLEDLDDVPILDISDLLAPPSSGVLTWKYKSVEEMGPWLRVSSSPTARRKVYYVAVPLVVGLRLYEANFHQHSEVLRGDASGCVGPLCTTVHSPFSCAEDFADMIRSNLVRHVQFHSPFTQHYHDMLVDGTASASSKGEKVSEPLPSVSRLPATNMDTDGDLQRRARILLQSLRTRLNPCIDLHPPIFPVYLCDDHGHCMAPPSTVIYPGQAMPFDCFDLSLSDVLDRILTHCLQLSPGKSPASSFLRLWGLYPCSESLGQTMMELENGSASGLPSQLFFSSQLSWCLIPLPCHVSGSTSNPARIPCEDLLWQLFPSQDGKASHRAGVARLPVALMLESATEGGAFPTDRKLSSQLCRCLTSDELAVGQTCEVISDDNIIVPVRITHIHRLGAVESAIAAVEPAATVELTLQGEGLASPLTIPFTSCRLFCSAAPSPSKLEGDGETAPSALVLGRLYQNAFRAACRRRSDPTAAVECKGIASTQSIPAPIPTAGGGGGSSSEAHENSSNDHSAHPSMAGGQVAPSSISSTSSNSSGNPAHRSKSNAVVPMIDVDLSSRKDPLAAPAVPVIGATSTASSGCLDPSAAETSVSAPFSRGGDRAGGRGEVALAIPPSDERDSPLQVLLQTLAMLSQLIASAGADAVASGSVTALCGYRTLIRGKVLRKYHEDSAQLCFHVLYCSSLGEQLALEYYNAASSTRSLPLSPSSAKSHGDNASGAGAHSSRSPSPIAISTVCPLGATGLNNLGNTCFLSSALQCLVRTPVLVPYLLSCQHHLALRLANSPAPAAGVVSHFSTSGSGKTLTGGTGGRLINEFSNFLRSYYDVSSTSKSAANGRSGNAAAAATGTVAPPSAASNSNGSAVTSSNGRYYGSGSGNGNGNGNGGSSGNSVSGSVAGSSHRSAMATSVQGTVALSASRPGLTVSSSYPALSPTQFYKLFQAHKSQFTGGDQQDAQECLSELLDTFHEDLKPQALAPSGPPQPVPAPAPTGESEGDNDNEGTASGTKPVHPADLVSQGYAIWHQDAQPQQQAGPPSHSQRTIISDLFHGQLCTYIVCKQCKNSAVKFEPFTTLSLPIPRQSSAASSATQSPHPSKGLTVTANTTVQVVVRIYRKMPKLSYILPLYYFALIILRNASTNPTLQDNAQDPEKTHVDGNVSFSHIRQLLNWKTLVRWIKHQRQVRRVVFTVPASTTVDDIRMQCVSLVASELDAQVATTSSTLDSSAPSRSSGSAACINITESEEIAAVLNPEKAMPLQRENCTMIDVSHDEKFKMRKILDSRDKISSILSDHGYAPGSTTANGSIVELLCLENTKNVGFIGNLPGHRLTYDSTTHTDSPSSLRPHPSERQSAIDEMSPVDMLEHLMVIYPRLLQAYVDKDEYDQNSLLNTIGVSHNPLLCDLDSRFVNSKLSKNSEVNAARKSWPRHVRSFQLGDRVDALDLKGQWYAGSIVEVFAANSSSFTANHASPQSSAAVAPAPTSGSKDKRRSHRESSSKSIGYNEDTDLFVRVHFDNYSHVWDEWYNQQDFVNGHLAPIFTKTQRKLKIFDLQIIHRNLFYTLAPPSGLQNGRQARADDASSLSGNHTTKSVNNEGDRPEGGYDSFLLDKIELAEAPQVIQCESYRSVHHLHQLIIDQMSRFLGDDFWDKINWETAEDVAQWPLPFKIRMLSNQNVYSAPQLASTAQYRQSLASLSYKDRFDIHKQWEGKELLSGLGNDYPLRPVSNVFHQKLVIAIDWEYFSPSEGSNGATGLSQPVSYPAQPGGVFSVLDYLAVARANRKQLGPSPRLEDLAICHQLGPSHFLVDHPSYAALLASFQQSQMSPSSSPSFPNGHSSGANGVGDNDAGHVDPGASTSTVGPAHGANSVNSTLAAAYATGIPELKDNRAGITLDEIIGQFIASEEIDYKCDHCRSMQQATLHTSIHHLPDVLILHLKRLVINMTGGMKVRTLVKFPLRNMNIKKYTTEVLSKSFPVPPQASSSSSSQAQPPSSSSANQHPPSGGDGNGGSGEDRESDKDVYDIFGVVNHLGGMFGGHYTSYAYCDLQHPGMTPPHHSNTAASGGPFAAEGGSGGGGSGAAGKLDVRKWYGRGDAPEASVTSRLTTTTRPVALQEYLVSLSPEERQAFEGGQPCGSVPPRLEENLQYVMNCASSGKWFKFDDEFVAELSDTPSMLHQTVVSESAYLLFYKKRHLSVENLMQYL